MHFKASVTGLAFAFILGCTANQAPNVSGNIRNSLKQAGLNDVTVSQDRTKGVVTLGGSVQQDADKARAQQIASSMASGEVVANEISVAPANDRSTAKNISSDLDKGIQANLDAVLTQANIKGIHHTVKNGVVTLTGDLNSMSERASAERVAAGVPNVAQVVNEIDVRNQRATTTYASRSTQ